jgi:hypothetical protein
MGFKLAVLLLAGNACMFAQSDRGTITGTITDPSGAVISNANIEARNTQTGAVSTGGSTATGNYNVAQIPTGTYQLTVTAPGFKTFVRQNIEVPVATSRRTA